MGFGTSRPTEPRSNGSHRRRNPATISSGIQRELAELEAYDAGWNVWFAEQGIVPLRIGYERLSGDPAAALASICKALGVPAPNAADVKPGVAKLSDEISLDWMRRYRLDAAI
ncbi:Stf0 family sulfotransferase [Mesorhizobium sp. M0222]|uniref:Stf0 family sulfotransferase n=1 Tax=Mesorhizobium sp. M0222 TaxID=2956921 RepID=UPI00333BF5CC